MVSGILTQKLCRICRCCGISQAVPALVWRIAYRTQSSSFVSMLRSKVSMSCGKKNGMTLPSLHVVCVVGCFLQITLYFGVIISHQARDPGELPDCGCDTSR